MLRATLIKTEGNWSGEPADVIVLSLDERHRRRIKMRAARGLVFLLDLPQATTLRGGDGLVLEDGRIVEVVAAAEPLTEISCPDATNLIRISWHLGNRHLQVQVLAKRLRIRRDPVIEDMLRTLGATLREIDAPFDPEGGAYAGSAISGASHAHDSHSGLGHAHAFDHGPHSRRHDPSAQHQERVHVDPHPHLQALSDTRPAPSYRDEPAERPTSDPCGSS
jgi:urease accessory protein